MKCRLWNIGFLWLIINLCSGEPQYHLSTRPSGVAVNSDNEEVFVSAGEYLLRLDRQLQQIEHFMVGSELLSVVLTPDRSRLVGCIGDGVCFVYDSHHIAGGPTHTVNTPYSIENGIAVITASHSFYIGSEGQSGANNRTIRLSQYPYTPEVVRNREYTIDGDAFVRSSFYGGFSRNGYVYYFVSDVALSASEVRVLRVCDCVLSSCPSLTFEALYDLTLRCSDNIDESEVCGVALLETFADQDEPVVVVTHCGNSTHVCGYLLSEIDSNMDTFYERCIDNASLSFHLPWEQEPRVCSLFTPLNTCNFNGVVPAIAPNSVLSEHSLANPGRNDITSGVAVRIGEVSLVYVAYSNAIAVFSITQTGSLNEQNFEDAIATYRIPSPVRDLLWPEGAGYIIVVTDELVYQLPVEVCFPYGTCSECVGEYRQSLCGWCTVENKCSQRSQCQSNTEERRWVESFDQCITSTLTPNHLVLETPTILNVSASPNLPPGLTYKCSFSGSESVFTIEVEAVEVMAGAVYECDLRGVITDLGTVLEVYNFSFISVEIGIPFATNEDALTIYDCDAASSCGGCVQTNNTCGWCIYGNLCSTTSDLCPVPTGVNKYYLKLENRSSYVDVCPTLDPASTSSGDYTQPVRVQRNLRLQTRNLPTPVDDFVYVCMLNDSIPLPAHYNASDETIICIILENNITSASTVPLELTWGNGASQYSLDENSEDDISCILYDCSQLALDCSSCLALNAMGLQCGWCSADASCAVMEECSNDASADQCPKPAITLVEPSRGPLEGGTCLNITVVDLGALLSDVVEVTLHGPSNVTSDMTSNVICNVTECEHVYVPRTQITCETDIFSFVGNYSVVVDVRHSADSVFSSSSGVLFSVRQPTVSGVSPAFGPVSGRVEVIISGSSLDIGNTEDTRVELNGVNCAIEEINNAEIHCTSNTSNGSRMGSVLVFIDNAIVNMSGVVFEYRDDPVYSSVSPQKIIPAGGITMKFEGINLDVVDQPIFKFTDSRLNSSDQNATCSVSNTAMICVMPSFVNNMQLPNNISYTILVGNAPGPDLSNGNLVLNAVPNPIFATNGSAIESDSECVIGSNFSLIINGSYLDSVERNEINVTVGGELCTEKQVDNNTIKCCPPDDTSGEAEIVVHIGTGLEYSVGNLTCISTTGPASPPIIAIIVGVAVAVPLTIVVVALALALMYKNRKKRTTEQENHNSSTTHIPLGNIPSPFASIPSHEIESMEVEKEEMKKQLPPELLVPSNRIRLLEAIGHGEFGEVYKAHLIKWHGLGMPRIVAVKTLRGIFTPNDVQQMMMEVVKMQKFDHPRVLSLLGVCLDSGVGIIMPYMANGSVLNYLKKEKAALLLSENADLEEILPVRRLLLRMCLQIAEGMEYLAQRKFVHRDLAARNCMLDSKGDVKVGDFGLAEDMYAFGYVREPNKGLKVPFRWMAPESLEEGLFSEHSDVWSYGVTCWEVFTIGKIPYPAVDPMILIKKVKEGYRLECPENPACNTEIYDVIKECWNMVPTERPSFTALVKSMEMILMTVSGYVELSMCLQNTEAETTHTNAVYDHLKRSSTCKADDSTTDEHISIIANPNVD